MLLIVANIGVFLWQISQPSAPNSSDSPHIEGLSQQDENTLTYGAIPYRLTHPGKECGVAGSKIVCQGSPAYPRSEKLDSPPWWVTIFTSMFMHGGILHIAFNMLFLWIFGNNIEDSMGRGRFVLFYLLAGIVAAYAQALLDTNATLPAIGASGAIAGVLGAYLMLFPNGNIRTVFLFVFIPFVVLIPAWIQIGLWALTQVFYGYAALDVDTRATSGGVAYFAHIGGFVAGIILVWLFKDEDAVKRQKAARAHSHAFQRIGRTEAP